MPHSLTIVVGGYIVGYPLGGMTWHHLHYLLGLHEMGHEVWFLEDSAEWYWPYDPTTGKCSADSSYGRAYLERTFAEYGLPAGRYCYYSQFEDKHYGLTHDELHDLLRRADLMLCVSGVTPVRPERPRPRRLAVIDTDPVFTQLLHLDDSAARDLALQHTAFFSFGENIGSPRSTIPDDGLPWQATRQPIVLDAWSAAPGPAQGKFTTVMQWSSYPAREYNGMRYGMKSDSFVPYSDLPGRVGPILELAVAGVPEAPPADCNQSENPVSWVTTGRPLAR